MKKFFKNDLWIVLLDVIAVNVSYYLALLIRFYVNSTFRPTVSYLLTDWARFAPFYTIGAIAIFAVWKLYGGMWRYAGMNDMNRIIGGSITASIIHVIATLIFIRRMPITYYVIGAVLQLMFLIVIRFSYRVLLAERQKLKSADKVPCVVIGSGDLGRKVIKHLEDNTPYRVVAILSNSSAGRTMDGIPVLGLKELENQVKNVRAIFIADKEMSNIDREYIRDMAGELEISDFTGALSNLGGSIPLASLLNATSGKVTSVMDGEEKQYTSGKAALEAVKDAYDVGHIESDLKVFVKKHSATVDTTWLENYKATTGEDVSFF